MFTSLWRGLVHAGRSLAKARAFTFVCVASLVRAYPRPLRFGEQEALEAACVECLSREHRRLGRFGAPYAWRWLIVDTIRGAILLRLDARRRRHLAWQHAPRSVPTEILMIRYAASLRSPRKGTRDPRP